MLDAYLQATQPFETINDFIRYGVSSASRGSLYYGHGTDNAWDDIRALVLRSLSLPYDIEPSFLNARLTTDEKQHLALQLMRRIEERVPVPYLTQEALFCNLPFYVDERVLIPRSPIAELIMNQFEPWLDATKVHSILDLCTGSGCIAIACAYAFPDAQVDASDISFDALSVAAINCERHDMDEQVNLIQSDCFDAIEPHRYSLIVSNPPYVGSDEMQTLPAEYEHEPVLALETENQGLAIVDKILQSAHAYLEADGLLVIEVGNSDEALMAAYPHIPFTWIEFERGGHGVFVLTAEQLRLIR